MKIIPHPQLYVKNDGIFSLTSATFLYAQNELKRAAELLNDLVEKCVGYRLCNGKDGISFVLEPSFEPEQYKITISKNSITAYCSAEQGAFNAVATLRQLLELDLPHTRFCNVNCCVIEDLPRFSHRGVSLDIVRHWFGKEHILRFIDKIASLKFNVLHLHLSDDQGYRIESEKYPKLNTVGSYREKTFVRSPEYPDKYDNVAYGGYLLKTEVKEIVEFASKMGVSIIPEIDLPGHMMAAISAYPELSCRGEQLPVRCEWGISTDILCAGKDSTYAFVENVLEEVCQLFPSPYIHLGGDEAPKNRWKKCPQCKNKLSQLGLDNFNQLQGYMFNYFAQFLAQKGKKVIGWNECICDNLDEDVIIQHWTVPFMRSNKPTVNAINNGRKAIMSSFTATYLDYPYSMTPLQTVYDFSPYLKGVKHKDNILGVECNIWCEHIRSIEKFDYNVFPRIVAFAENAWSKKRDYEDFCRRLGDYYKILDEWNVHYAKNKEFEGKNFQKTIRFFTKDADIEINDKKE